MAEDSLLSSEDIERYLERIGFPGLPTSDLASLAVLQRCHLGAVPFENLNVYERIGVGVELAWSVPKVLSGRGGWCFELNGAFGALLQSLGFRVDLVGAKVLLGTEPPVPDHLALIVHLDRRYLVDVGFGVSFTRPFILDSDEVVIEEHGQYRLSEMGEGEVLLEFAEGDAVDGEPDSWVAQYRLDLTPVQLSTFNDRSEFLQTDPSSHFRDSPFATRLMPGGRVTLLKDRIKFREYGIEREIPVSAEEWSAQLRQWFKMDL